MLPRSFAGKLLPSTRQHEPYTSSVSEETLEKVNLRGKTCLLPRKALCVIFSCVIKFHCYMLTAALICLAAVGLKVTPCVSSFIDRFRFSVK